MITIIDVADRVVDAIRWLTPGFVIATKDDVGTVTFRTGWCGWHVTETVYRTPLGEIPHAVPYSLGCAILEHARDWVDALVLVTHEQEGCDCEADQ